MVSVQIWDVFLLKLRIGSSIPTCRFNSGQKVTTTKSKLRKSPRKAFTNSIYPPFLTRE